jgi:hypothetical protein
MLFNPVLAQASKNGDFSFRRASMRLRSSILVLALAISTAAGANKRPARVTGNQLIAELRGGLGARHDFDKPYIHGYVAGVADMTQGAQWCAPAGLDAAQIEGRVLDALATRPAGSMPDAAATVLVEQFRSTYPQKEAACAVTPRLTGNRFISWLLGDTSERERFAAGYIGGVVDATQGIHWCAPTRIKPHELEERGWANLADRPPDSMRGNAAVLLHQQFIAKYPCTQR